MVTVLSMKTVIYAMQKTLMKWSFSLMNEDSDDILEEVDFDAEICGANGM